jgi:hypothetical protein
VQMRGELNYDDEESRRYVLLSPSTAIDYEFSQHVSGFVEGVGQWNALRNRWQAALNLGPQLHITDNLILDGGAHLALTRETDREYFLGLSFRH